MGALSAGLAAAVHWLNVLNGLSMPVKIGWVVFFVWVLVQIEWYLRARTAALPVKSKDQRVRTNVMSPKRLAPPAIAETSGKRSHYSPSRSGGSPEFFAALGLDEPERSPAPEEEVV